MSTVTFPDISTTEGTYTTSDNISLYTKTWHPSTPPKARLVFLHGFSDHCNFYGVLFPTLAQKGIKVYAYDQRGWGKNVKKPSDRGDTGPTKRILEDLTGFIQQLPSSEDEVPIFLMGHSMGGGEVLYYAATGPDDVRKRIRGYLCEAPFIALHENGRPWKMTVALGRLAGKLLPKKQLLQKLEASKLCRDQDVCKEWEEDPLNHDTATLECLAAMLDRAAELEDETVKVTESSGEGGKARIWIGFGTGDALLSCEVASKWFEKVGVEDKEFRAYEGWYHKLHSEPGEDKFTFAEDTSKWILERSGPLDQLVAKPKL